MPHPGLLHPEPLALQQATADWHLCRRHSNTQRQVWPNLCRVSWCAQGSICALPESASPVLCKFWQLYGGSMATSSKRTFAIPRSAAPRAPAPVAGHCWPVPPQETPKHSSVSVSVGSLGPGAHKVCLSPLSVSGRYGV